MARLASATYHFLRTNSSKRLVNRTGASGDEKDFRMIGTRRSLLQRTATESIRFSMLPVRNKTAQGTCPAMPGEPGKGEQL